MPLGHAFKSALKKAARSFPAGGEMNATPSNRLDALRALGRALRRSSRLTQTTLEAVLSKRDLNLGQWSALLIVVDTGEITVAIYPAKPK